MPAEPRDEDVLWELGDDGIGRLTLNRPHTGNAVNATQRETVITLLRRGSTDARVRVILLTGAGDKHFCTGADLSGTGPPAPGRSPGAVGRAVSRGAQRLVAAVLDCEKPVIAVVNGTAAGIGCHLAFACDLVLASDSARFIEIFARRGLVADGGGAYLLPRLIGPQRTKELMFFGDALPASEAYRIGLVNRVVPAAELRPTATRWAGRLAESPTVALTLTKRLVNRSLESDRMTAFTEEAMAQEINMTCDDAKEGLRAFAQRREPVFEGR